jgi:hypothetical protein
MGWVSRLRRKCGSGSPRAHHRHTGSKRTRLRRRRAGREPRCGSNWPPSPTRWQPPQMHRTQASPMSRNPTGRRHPRQSTSVPRASRAPHQLENPAARGTGPDLRAEPESWPSGPPRTPGGRLKIVVSPVQVRVSPSAAVTASMPLTGDVLRTGSSPGLTISESLELTVTRAPPASTSEAASLLRDRLSTRHRRSARLPTAHGRHLGPAGLRPPRCSTFFARTERTRGSRGGPTGRRDGQIGAFAPAGAVSAAGAAARPLYTRLRSPGSRAAPPLDPC